MKYPKKYTPEGCSGEIATGDLVWWNEGVDIGYVLQIVKEGDDLFCEEVFNEPHISFYSLHPYNPDAEWNSGIFYPYSVLEDEGVGPLSDHEKNELNWAISQARALSQGAYEGWPCNVRAIKDVNRGESDWLIKFIKSHDEVSEVFKVPFRPNTRTIIG